MGALLETNLDLPNRRSGKVRDLYDVTLDNGEDALLIVATDRVSAFDVVMANGLPGKGIVLTQLSKFWFGVAIHRYVLRHVQFYLLDIFADSLFETSHHRRFDRRRIDRVHPDVHRRTFFCRRAHQADDRMFTRRIGCNTGRAADAGNRRSDHDAAAAAFV